MLFENESPDVVGMVIAECWGLGVPEKGDTDLELTPDAVRTGFGTVCRRSTAVDKITSFSCNKEGICEDLTRKNVSDFFPCLAALLSNWLYQINIRWYCRLRKSDLSLCLICPCSRQMAKGQHYQHFLKPCSVSQSKSHKLDRVFQDWGRVLLSLLFSNCMNGNVLVHNCSSCAVLA